MNFVYICDKIRPFYLKWPLILPYLVTMSDTIIMIIHIRHQNSFSKSFFHLWPNVMNGGHLGLAKAVTYLKRYIL